jgi:hypothetical protein
LCHQVKVVAAFGSPLDPGSSSPHAVREGIVTASATAIVASLRGVLRRTFKVIIS